MKILTFDLDGTLFDTRQDIANAVNYAREEFNLSPLSLSQITKMVGHGITVLAQRAFQGSNVDPAAACERILEYYKQHPADHAKLYPGIGETLPKLNFIRTIVSNKRKALVDALLEKEGLAEYFDFVAGGDTFSNKKPDPEAIHFLLQRYQASRSEILVVGDHTPDILMARRAGVRSVFCRYGFFGVDESGADYEIDSFPEILTILTEIANQEL